MPSTPMNAKKWNVSAMIEAIMEKTMGLLFTSSMLSTYNINRTAKAGAEKKNDPKIVKTIYQPYIGTNAMFAATTPVM